MGASKYNKPIKGSGKKINDGSLKIFEFLKLLYADEATYEKVSAIYKDDDIANCSSNNLQVIINKQINTLKVFGIKIEKEKGKYRLLNSIYSMEVTNEDLKSLSILVAGAESLLDEKYSKHINKVATMFEVRLSNEDRCALNSLKNNLPYEFNFFYSDLKHQIEKCNSYCERKVNLNLIYLNKKDQQVVVKCVGEEIIYSSKTVYFKIIDTINFKSTVIPINRILEIKESPSQRQQKPQYKVSFKIKGRLAPNYHMRDWEYLSGVEPDGIIITNEGEPYDELLARLMRYSTCCEVISPSFFKEQMMSLINETLEYYD